MSMSKPFRLLDLPDLPLSRILVFMTPIPLAKLSKCSTTASQLAQRTAASLKVSRIVITFGGTTCSLGILMKNVKLTYHFSSYQALARCMALYKEAFGWSMNALLLSPGGEQVQDALEVLERFGVFNRERTAYQVDLADVGTGDHHRFPSRCDTNKLIIKNTKLRVYSTFHPNIDEILFQHSWIRAKDIMMRSNFSTIIFCKALVMDGMSTFIDLWKTGHCPRLEVALGTLHCSEWNKAIQKVAETTAKNPERKRQFSNRSGTAKLEVKGGYDVKRNDGTIATICIIKGAFGAFVVWRNDNGS